MVVVISNYQKNLTNQKKFWLIFKMLMIMNPLNGVSFSAGANHNRRIMRKAKKYFVKKCLKNTKLPKN